ncbi:hypothetical protein [Burkholderia sp. Bp9142]|uniref:hypothetical protein n=1 Tax=Burkholderia sp. Bp9142 TaxID=2184573 RepID=UPI000F5A3480|nr:hypothetical protein [Burkholderia sp. Bp9142]RQR34840.1 hypothetical protein DIE22_16270 [Burkholderia sp. Bp9142]
METLSLGKSSIDTTYFYGTVTGGGAHGPGICQKVVGMSSKGDLLLTRLPMHDDRSGSKRSGSVNYELTGNGVYRAYGYADSNRSEGPEIFFELDGDSLRELNRNQLDERLRLMSPENYATMEHNRRKAARRTELLPEIQAEVNELAADRERLEVTMVAVDDQLELSRLAVTRHKSCGHFDEIAVDTVDELVVRLSAPSAPCPYCEASAKKAQADQEAMLRLQDAAATNNLPPLSGSPRQIKWALEIRDGFWRNSPESPLLKRATTAKYWIEHRNELK